MATTVSHLTQSNFYSPVFNSAIFDGPLRLYFAQYQESLALQVYFRLQKAFDSYLDSLKKQFKEEERFLFLLMYPTVEDFDRSFQSLNLPMEYAIDFLEHDVIVGLRGPQEEAVYESLNRKMQSLVGSIAPMSAQNFCEADQSIE